MTNYLARATTSAPARHGGRAASSMIFDPVITPGGGGGGDVGDDDDLSRPSIEVSRCDNPTSVGVDDSAQLTAQIENTGDSAKTVRVEWDIDGTVVAKKRRVKVPAGGTVGLARSFTPSDFDSILDDKVPGLSLRKVPVVVVRKTDAFGIGSSGEVITRHWCPAMNIEIPEGRGEHGISLSNGSLSTSQADPEDRVTVSVDVKNSSNGPRTLRLHTKFGQSDATQSGQLVLRPGQSQTVTMRFKPSDVRGVPGAVDAPTITRTVGVNAASLGGAFSGQNPVARVDVGSLTVNTPNPEPEPTPPGGSGTLPPLTGELPVSPMVLLIGGAGLFTLMTILAVVV